MTTAMPSMVATPEITISQRTRATMCACAGLERLVVGDRIAHGGAQTRVATVIVGGADAGERLDRVLAAHLADLSRSRLKALILAGHVAIGGRTIRDPGHHVNAGDEIARRGAAGRSRPSRGPEPIPLDVVYEDDDLIVIDKPRGLVVHPAAGNWTGTLVNALIAHCGDSLSGIGGVRRPGIVHRLDKDTTGLMVVAKTDRAHRALAAQFADHGRTGPLERGYLAFVWGVPDRPKGTIDKPIDRHPHRARQDGGARRRPRGGDPLAGAGALSGRRHGGGEPARLPAGDRPHPPDPGPPGRDRPSPPGR